MHVYRLLRAAAANNLLQVDSWVLDAGMGSGDPLLIHSFLAGSKRILGYDSCQGRVNTAHVYHRRLAKEGFFPALTDEELARQLRRLEVNQDLVEVRKLAGGGFPDKVDLVYGFVQGWRPADVKALIYLAIATASCKGLVLLYDSRTFKSRLRDFGLEDKVQIVEQIPVFMQGSGERFTGFVLRVNRAK